MKPLTVTQAAEESGLSVALIRRACASGDLWALKLGRDWTFSPRDFETWRARVRHYRKLKERE